VYNVHSVYAIIDDLSAYFYTQNSFKHTSWFPTFDSELNRKSLM